MPRTLDLTALRAFVTVADAGGVTRAARQLNLTQSAVSMQLKRLEAALGQPLLERSGRGVGLTPHGEKLLSHGRQMLALNDRVWAEMQDAAYEGEIRFGVPHDIVYPHIPGVLRRFALEFPRVKVVLISSYTRNLLAAFERGELDLILTTEDGPVTGSEVLDRKPLVWTGASDGVAWRQRPLPLAFERWCVFRAIVQAALDRAGIPWVQAIESEMTRTVDATVSADLAVHVNVEGNEVPYVEEVRHGGALPALPEITVNMYIAHAREAFLTESLAQLVREAYGVSSASQAA